MDVEATHYGATGNLDLELLSDMVFIGLATTFGALFGQRHVDDLVGLLFWKGPMGLGAVVPVRLGRCFGERSGLSFLAPGGLLQKLLQLRQSLLELSVLLCEPHAIGPPHCCLDTASHNTTIGNMAA